MKDVQVTSRGNGARRQGIAWEVRASDHRREQVRARVPVPVPTTPTGPVLAGSGVARIAATTLTSLDALWTSLVDVLDAVEAPAYALLSTESGFPLRGHGYSVRDLVPAVRAATRTFEARRGDAIGTEGVATLELASGTTQTVIAAIAARRGEHLLCVTADGVSMPVLRAWTHHTATKFGALLDQS